MDNDSKCPVTGGHETRPAGHGTSNQDWWPHQLNLNILRLHSENSIWMHLKKTSLQ